MEKDNAYKNRSEPNYEEAIRYYLAALNCPDRPAPEEDQLPALIEETLKKRVKKKEDALAKV